MREKLHSIRKPWHRLAIDVLLNFLLFINRFTSPRARVHWVGYDRRARRWERRMVFLLFSGAMVLLEPHEYILWSIALGSALTLFLLLATVYRLTPRKRRHWVGK